MDDKGFQLSQQHYRSQQQQKQPIVIPESSSSSSRGGSPPARHGVSPILALSTSKKGFKVCNVLNIIDLFISSRFLLYKFQATSNRRQSGFLHPVPSFLSQDAADSWQSSAAAPAPSKLEESLLLRSACMMQGRGSRAGVPLRTLFSLCDDSAGGAGSGGGRLSRPVAPGGSFACAGVRLCDYVFKLQALYYPFTAPSGEDQQRCVAAVCAWWQRRRRR